MSVSTLYMISAISSVATAAFTLGLVAVAFFQLRSLNNQKKAEFLFNFNNRFFDAKTNRAILETIEDKKLLLKDKSGNFDEYDLDEYLGDLDLIENYIKKGIMDFDLVYEAIGHYAARAWESKEIKEYIEKLRKDTGDPDYYKPFEELAKRTLIKESGRKNS